MILMYIYVDGFQEYDWSRIKELDFQEKWTEKWLLLKSLDSYQCNLCPDLNDHVFFSSFLEF